MTKRAIKKRKLTKECWNLDISFLLWLQERLPVYLQEAGKMVDLSYHKFNIYGKVYTQEEVIKLMISDIKKLLEVDWCYEEENTIQNRLLKCWAEVFPAMWW